MKIQEISVKKIRPATYNPRVDLQPNDADYIAIKRSIEKFGDVDPLVWNEVTGNLVGGHQRFKILVNDLRKKKVWCFIVHIESHAEERALNIALNKIGGDWDRLKLSALFRELRDQKFDMDFTGFQTSEIASVLQTVPFGENHGLDYVKKFEVIVECKDEADQQKIYERLVEEGYRCRVLTL